MPIKKIADLDEYLLVLSSAEASQLVNIMDDLE
jgi:hypothetical protein